MMALVGYMVFALALAASLSVFWFTLAPALPRIVALLQDGVDPAASVPRGDIVSQPRLRSRVTATFAAPAWQSLRAAA